MNKYKNMLDEIFTYIEEKHLDMYVNLSKEEFHDYKKKLIDKYEVEDIYDVYYIGNQLIKKLFGTMDSHTFIAFQYNYDLLPLKYKYTNDKLYVIRTDEDNKDILYGKVKKINDIEIEKLVKKIEKLTVYSTNGYLEYAIEEAFNDEKILRSLPGISKDSTEFSFEIEKEEEMIQKTIRSKNISLNEDKNYTYEVEDDVIILKYSACRDEEKMNPFIMQIESEANEKNISKYIVDLRGNRGGNSSIIKPLIKFLDGKEVVTLVDKYVFSSGRYAIIDLKNIGSKFVGTEISTTLNCFGNNPDKKVFDDIYVAVASRYFYYNPKTGKMDGFSDKETFKKAKNTPENSWMFDTQKFMPDYYVENSIDDLKNGVDRQKNFAKNLLQQNKHKYERNI